MAVVKFILSPGESEEAAKDLLLKALKLQASGDTHGGEEFSQPAAQAVVRAMEAAHASMWKTMLKEIEAVIDEETAK